MTTRVIDQYFFENKKSQPQELTGAYIRIFCERFLRPVIEGNQKV